MRLIDKNGKMELWVASNSADFFVLYGDCGSARMVASGGFDYLDYLLSVVDRGYPMSE